MSSPKYWRGLDELEQTPEFIQSAEKEFPTDKSIDQVMAEASEESMNMTANRRDFLKVLGFGVTAATLSSCAEGPVKKAIPYVEKPLDNVPGVPNFYASTTPDGSPCLVKTREGRPIKLEPNPDATMAQGGLTAIDQAQVLNLYDTDRLRGPLKGESNTSWEMLDNEVKQNLEAIRAKGGSVRVLTNTVLSPSLQATIDNFLGTFENSQQVTYDALSLSAMAKVYEKTFGKRMIPTFRFEKAMTIASFNCDFLGSWLNPAQFAAQYAVHRDPGSPDTPKKMSRHHQFESLMTITGAKADMRYTLQPSNEGIALLNLYNAVASKTTGASIPGVKPFSVWGDGIETAAKELVANRGASIVVSGTNDYGIQLLVAGINKMLGNFGKTIDVEDYSMLAKGDDEALAGLISELKAGQVNALIMMDANPVYDTQYGADFAAAIPNAELSVAMTFKANETSELAQYTAATSHFLESWGDAQQSLQTYSLIQPTINTMFDTRQAADCFLNWANTGTTYAQYLKRYWRENLYITAQGQFPDFRTFWNETLRKGVFVTNVPTQPNGYALDTKDLNHQKDILNGRFSAPVESFTEMELVFFTKVGIGSGEYANNPWLQELPDPVQKVTWDNYVTVPYDFAQANGLKNEDVVEITVDGQAIHMPVVIQPGQARGTLGVALGYGRTKAGRVAIKANGTVEGGKQIAGTNVYPMTSMENGAVSYTKKGVTVSKTSMTYPLALTQTFNTLYDPAKGVFYGNDFDRTQRIVEETYTAAYTKGYKEQIAEREAEKSHLVSLWDAHYTDSATRNPIHWNMAIDLNKCTGCGSCVVACNAENNVPVVGKEEVRNRREMHWMRIDRYYSGNPNNPDNINAVFQPMLCQHCDNAPCETVCPVLATIHSNEGLNQMTYNRCVGTRYCANNCPYKVRRFNWFNYWNDDEKFGDFYSHQKLGRLVLNPDVTVRFRGVMEKCSFCVQRLQDAKLRAKVNAGGSFNTDGQVETPVVPEDGAVQTACQQACPTGAIIFGNLNDKDSEIAKAWRASRAYTVLADVKVLPSVAYHAVVRNRTEEEATTLDKEFDTWRSELYKVPVEDIKES